MRPEGLSQRKIPMPQSDTETTTFRLAAHCLDKLRHREHSVIAWHTELVLSPVLTNQSAARHR